VLAQAVHHLTDQLVAMGLFYTTNTTLVSARIKGVTGRGPNSTDTWNAEQWTTAATPPGA
jgi:hypothetical protein